MQPPPHKLSNQQAVPGVLHGSALPIESCEEEMGAGKWDLEGWLFGWVEDADDGAVEEVGEGNWGLEAGLGAVAGFEGFVGLHGKTGRAPNKGAPAKGAPAKGAPAKEVATKK